MLVQQENVIRPTANFPLSVWGDQFLAYEEVCEPLKMMMN